MIREAMIAALVLAAWPRQAYACKLVPCFRAEVLPASGELPQDRVAFWFKRAVANDAAGTELPHLLIKDSSVEVPLSATEADDDWVRLVPTVPLSVGTKLALSTGTLACKGDGLHTEYVIGEPRPNNPTSLGTLTASVQQGSLRVAVISGQCGLEIDAAYADLTLALSSDAQPMQSLYHYQVIVDGREHAGFSPALAQKSGFEPGHERIYAVCRADDDRFNAPEALTPGSHQVRMRGTLASGASFETPEIAVQLQCPTEAQSRDASAEISPPRALLDEDEGCNLAGGGSAQAAWLLLAWLGVRRTRRHKRA